MKNTRIWVAAAVLAGAVQVSGQTYAATSPAAPAAPVPPEPPMLAMTYQGRLATTGGRAEQQYSQAMRALDQKKWEEALNGFKQVTSEGGARADAALYWSAYAQNKLGQQSVALATLDTLKKNHPNSRWLNDAKALEVEVKQASGRPVSPDQVSDDDMKLMALNGLMQNNPERALPLVEKILMGSQSPKVKERALFVLSQSDSPQAKEILVKIAKGGSNPDLQRLAIRNLGVHGGKQNSGLLGEIYQSQSDPSLKREILRSFMVSGDSQKLAALAKSEKDEGLRREAIRQLGAMGDTKSLTEMLASESDAQVRMEAVNALMISGASQPLIDIANNDKDPAVKRKAIQMLGVMGVGKTGDALVQIYQKAGDAETKKTALRGMFTQGNAKALVDAARKETDPELKREAVRMLSTMKSKEASEYMLELLEK